MKDEGGLLLAQRVSWELESGPIPDGLFVGQTCDNPPSINPTIYFGHSKRQYARLFQQGQNPYSCGRETSKGQAY